VLGEQRAGGGLKIATILAVARRFAVEVGILPAEIDSVTALEGIAGGLAAGLIKTNNWVGGLVDGGTGRGKAIALIGDLVVLVDTDGLLVVGFLVEIRAVDGNIVRRDGHLGSWGGRFGHDGALHSGEETVGVGKDLVGPGGVGAAGLGVDIASRTEGQGAGGRVEVSAGAEVAGRPTLAGGIPPAVLDGVAAGKVVACGLAGGLVEVEEGFGVGTVGYRADGRLPIEFIGELVVTGGASLLHSLRLNTGGSVAPTHDLRHPLGRLVGTEHPGEQPIERPAQHVLRPKLVGPARLGVHVALLVLGEQRAGGRLERAAVLAVARRLAAEVGIDPAEVDGVASREAVARGLAAVLVEADDGVGRLVDGRAGRGQAVGFVGDLVVGRRAGGSRLGARAGASRAVGFLGRHQERGRGRGQDEEGGDGRGHEDEGTGAGCAADAAGGNSIIIVK